MILSKFEFKETEIGKVPKYWQVKTAEDIKSPEKKSIISGPFGSNISAKYFVESGVPVIRGNNLSLAVGEKFKDNGFVYISNEKAKELNTWANIDDLIFTAVGTIGQVGIVSENLQFSDYIISNKQLRLTVDQEQVLPIYAYYWFSSPKMVKQIIQRNTGSSVPLINLSVLKSLLIPIPPLQEQKAIVEVLSSLDDKIDLLHRQNQTLEQLAETLFRQWFVEEAEEEWENGVLGDLFTLQRGFDLPKQNRVDGPYSIYAASGESGGHNEFKIKGPGVTTGRSGILGNVFYIPQDFWPLNTSLFIKEFKRSSPLYAYYFLKTIDLQSFNAGSAVPTLNRNHVHSNPVSIPPSILIEKFEYHAKTKFRKIEFNNNQILMLTQLRDTLLPKLMSGEIRPETNGYTEAEE